ncbi:MAG: VOC family protein [Thermoleophilia bacterium]|nr:VOC family protein [Thermoleophilia bacterium]
MRYTALDHVGFTVSSLDRSIPFYTRLLGEEPALRKVWDVEYVGRIVGYPGVRMECAFWRLPGGTILELLQYLDPPPGRVDMETYNAGNAHLCLVTDDIHADFERLRGSAEFRDPEPVAIPWGPYEGGWAAYLRDPDGITIELLQEPPGGPKL